MVAPLPGPLAHLAPLLDQYGYAVVGGLILVEDFGVPAPGESILIAAALYAGAGRLNIVIAAVVAVVAAIAGDNLGYLIGRTAGCAAIRRWGRYVLLTPERLQHAEDFFTRHGPKIITIARFIEGLRQANGIVAGVMRMPWRRFLIYNALGAVLWVGLWCTVGYVAGTHLVSIYETISNQEIYLLVLLVIPVAMLLVRYLRHRRRD